IQGTEFESYSYFMNISKKINDAHQLSFTAFAAPQWHNQRNNADRLTIENWQKQPLKYKYNASYGFDMNGQRKQSSYNYYNKPQISLNHFWTIDEKSSLSTALYMSIGDGGGYSGQGTTSADRNNWFGVPSGTGEPAKTFRNLDGTFNYGAIYELNKASDLNTSGSKMVMSNSINQHIWYGALSTYNTKIGDIDYYGGVDLRYYKGVHTNEISDLYGGNFFLDVSSDRPLNPNNAQLKATKLGVGDVVYRDYDGYVFSQGVFGQAEYNKDNLSTFISLSGSNTTYWRYDRFYYDAANAKSATTSFLGYCAKGGSNYNIDDNQNVFANVGIISRAPFFSGGAFLQSTTSNMLNPNGINEKAFSAEVGYGYKSKYFSGNLNVYRTKWLDKTIVVTSTQQQEVQYANLEGVNALHQGIEFDFMSKPTTNLEITGMISLGDWTWDSNSTGYLYTQTGQPSDEKGLPTELMSATHSKVDVNLKGIRVGNSAQTTAAIGASYQIIKGFRIGLDGNFYGKNYSSFRINSALGTNNFEQPWMIPNAYTVDFMANYRFRIGDYDASLVGNIDNLLDAEYITDAYDGTTHTAKDAQVFYGFGRTWSVSLKIKF
ncbi:MAG: TonB-dependent receptor, partial [Paludibacter sp.]